MSIKIVIDSASDIDQSEANDLGLTLIPMEIRFKDEEYLDGINITKKEFFEKLVESSELPKTSQINPQSFEDEFERLIASGHEVIAITISSKLSGTYNNAKKASEKYKDKVYVIDSLSACIGERLLVLYALNLLKTSDNIESIVEELNRIKTKINVMAMLDTLKYLKKGGRISPLVAFAGEILSIKPVVSIIDGEIKLIGKAMGSKKGNNLLNTLVTKKGIDYEKPFGVVWSGFDDTILKKYVIDSESIWKNSTKSVPSYMIGSTVGTHIGPNAIGFSFFEN